MEFYKIPKKPRVFQNSKNFKKRLISPNIFNIFGILEFWKTRGFFGILVLQRISQNIFGILDNSVVCNLSVSFVLNCSHLSIICFHLLIRSVHFLNRSSYLRTTFLLHSYLLDFYFPFTYLHISALMLYY